jgi:NAD(P)H-flavin reductase
VFKSSHEAVNRWHRPVGRIIYILLCLHAAFYINYFIGVGILVQRLFAPIVFTGVLAFIAMNLLTATALRSIRQFSYRLFFITHLISAFAIPPLVFYHARSARLFMAVALIAFILDLITRKIDTVTSEATVERIAGTNLVKISASLPHNKIGRFRAFPGSHIYLSIPAAARLHSDPASIAFLLFEFLFNPFTVAAIDDETGVLTLVARHTGGPLTTALARFAGLKPANTVTRSTIVSREEGKIPLCIEGPYGVSRHFPHLASGDFDRVLLIAGGIGATFILPLYHSILHDSPAAKVEMIWAVRGAGDATWAVTGTNGKGRSLMEDENVHIFLTGDILNSDDASASRVSRNNRQSSGQRSSSVEAGGDGEVEMSAMYRDRRRGGRFTSSHNRKRPDLKKIVDDVFRQSAEERVAVVVCGPEEMGREVRGHVGAWVYKGRRVFWHNEGFGW